MDLLSTLPAPPDFDPVAEAVSQAGTRRDEATLSALRLFQTMPPSTGVIANPVLYRVRARWGDADLELRVRGFGVRGVLREEDILTGRAGPDRLVFVGLFGRLPKTRNEERRFSSLLLRTLRKAVAIEWLEDLARLVGRYPSVTPETAIQHAASLCKARSGRGGPGVRAAREPSNLLRDLLEVHLTHALTGATAAYMRRLLASSPGAGPGKLANDTRSFIETSLHHADAVWETFFALLLGRMVTATEARILRRLGTIQIHHGSAGSSMVARYMASLGTAWTSDLFVAAQMAMDGRRHFGAIHDMSEFVGSLEDLEESNRRERIRERLLEGNLPGFGHPEIAAAGRTQEMECDPRPALYLEPLFDAIDAGEIRLDDDQTRRLTVAVEMYDEAFVTGIRKPGSGHQPPLRIAPNTDFGAWSVQEALGAAEPDRTLLSYIFRGFGWMMDAREQLQQPLIRPVIPPDPRIVPDPLPGSPIPEIVLKVHDRLRLEMPFAVARLR